MLQSDMPSLAELAAMAASGQVEAALAQARTLLQTTPGDIALHQLAGLCAAELGRIDEAETHWCHALALSPNQPELHFNLGLAQARTGRPREAEASYRQALALSPASLEVRLNLANLLAAQARTQEAEAAYREAAALAPDYADVHYNLGLLLRGQQRDDEAEACFRRTLELDPGSAEAHGWLGLILADRHAWDEAQQHYLQALALKPGYVDAWCNLGLLLGERRQWRDAEQCLRHAITLSPDRAKLHANLGSLLLDMGQTEAAEAAVRHAIKLAPASAQAWSNLGVLLSNDGREDEAETCFRQAIALNPESPLARFNFAQQLLIQGRFAEGWAYYEARFDPNLHSQTTFVPRLPIPRWQGEPLVGKSLLVWMEQGFGDEIQFCRYLPLLKAQGVAQITLVCHPPLKALLETLEGVDTVLAVDDEETDVKPHDCWTFLLSLPHFFRTDLDNIPARLPYLAVPEAARAKWAGRLPQDGHKVGLVWLGNPRHLNDHERSLPGLAALAPLWEVPGVHFYSLQKGRDEAPDLPGQPIVNLGPELADFADTAAVVAQLDLVICVDTAVAHLAGALGKPCWVLLPAFKTDWRWLQKRPDSPWYPGVLRLIRQPQRGNWTVAIQEARDSLRRWVSARG